jgi:protein-L-isoaspartate(D-aspartate) O-methyltransferase
MEFMLTLRQRGISDKAVLRAMDAVPREHFVEARFAESAYADQAMPIACGQTISQPYVVAYMTEQLQVRPNHRVLEIGTGSGYQAAVLSRLAREVVTIERYRTLANSAHHRHRGGGEHSAGARRATCRGGHHDAAARTARRRAGADQADQDRAGAHARKPDRGPFRPVAARPGPRIVTIGWPKLYGFRGRLVKVVRVFHP